MRSGLKKPRQDRRDYDYLKNHHSFAGVPIFPASFNIDPNLWQPNQNEPQAIMGYPTVPALPYGCTDYSQTDLCVTQDGRLYNPMALEILTHANEKGGADMRASLDAARKAFGRTAYFNIKRAGAIDSFDAARIAIGSGQPEKRAVSVGSIWYPEWLQTGADGILKMPGIVQTNGPWHNWTICGWASRDGVPYLVGKSWQGPGFGDKGFHYISREVFNTIMSVSGAVMFTLSRESPGNVALVDLNWVANIVSLIRNLIASAYGAIFKTA